jgi:hypothetical protein
MRFIGFLLSWSIVIFGIPIALAALGASIDIAVWVGMGLLFGAIAHISQSPYGKHLRNKELNPFSTRFGESSEPYPQPKPLLGGINLSRLDVPLRRVAFLVFVLGLIVCLATVGVYEVNHRIDFLDAMFNRPYRFWAYKIAMMIGLTLVIAGYLCAFHFEKTAGRLVRWVKTGN